jgi:hypothetical protein
MKHVLLSLAVSLTCITAGAQHLARLYHYGNQSTGGHFYTIDWKALQKGDAAFKLEKTEGVVHIAPDQGTSPVYAYLNQWAHTHFYTITKDEIYNGEYGYHYQGIAFYAYKTEVPGTVPLYRYFSKQKQAHLYTTNYNEYEKGKDSYFLEGIAFYIFPKDKTVKTANKKTAKLKAALVTRPGATKSMDQRPKKIRQRPTYS